MDQEDKFTINSINLRLSDSDYYYTEAITNELGQAVIQLPFGKYNILRLALFCVSMAVNIAPFSILDKV